jgi:2-dehydro-3-deoxyphosphogluconate aldolase/(4S)-4-hydroxy-2-oxoglutarate aldolase
MRLVTTVIERLAEERAIAILRTKSPELAAPALAAAIAGGFRVVEVTLGTPGAFDRIAELASDSKLLVGAGTVLSVEEAQRAVERGARFLVSPVTDPEVIREAARLGAVMIPGALTPTEMLAAHRAGAPLVKLFPAPANGAEYVRSVLGPLPFLRIVPTSGVDGSNASDFLRAGCFALGFVRSLFDPDELAARAFDRVEARARALLAVVRAAPRG